MNRNYSGLISILAMAFMMFLILMLNINCGIHVLPAYGVNVENRLERPVVVYAGLILDDGTLDTVSNHPQIDPGEKRGVIAMGPPEWGNRKYQIEARTLDGQVIWKREYTREQIEAMGYLLVIDKYDKNNGSDQ